MREATWAQIGTDVREATTVDRVLKEAKLDYEVELRPVFMEGGMRIPNSQVAVRTADNHPFGIVSDKYKLIQNRDAFDFVNYLSDEITFEKAGETANGMVYIIAKLPEKNILGDSFTPHVIFRNGFSGGYTISAAICPLRCIFQNQFNFAFKNTANTVNIRHLGNASGKLIEARATLKTSYAYMEELEVEAEKYATVHLSERQIDIVLDKMFPLEDNATKMRESIVQREKSLFIEAYQSEDNRNFRGSAWGLINAYTDYKTHVNRSRGDDHVRKLERKFISTTIGQPMNKIIDVVEAVR